MLTLDNNSSCGTHTRYNIYLRKGYFLHSWNMLRALRRLHPVLATDVSVLFKSLTNNCIMTVPISGCVDSRDGYCAPYDHALIFEGARRDDAHPERPLRGRKRRVGPLAVQKNGVCDFPAPAGQAPEDMRLVQGVSSLAV